MIVAEKAGVYSTRLPKNSVRAEPRPFWYVCWRTEEGCERSAEQFGSASNAAGWMGRNVRATEYVLPQGHDVRGRAWLAFEASRKVAA